MLRKHGLSLALILSFLLSACFQGQTLHPTPTTVSPTIISNSPGTSLPPVTLADSEMRNIKSTNTGRDYDIYILLPPDYAQNTDKNYPVLYVLDGQWDFKLYASIYGGLHYDEFVPDMIIVGITYSGPNPDYETLRAMDLTPAAVGYHPGSGDAPKFLTFIKEELFPLIESNYRTDPTRRILTGSSYGGLFTLYALLTDPSMFSGYIAGSPVVTYNASMMYDIEKAYASEHKDLPVKLFIAVGGLEELKFPVEDFAKRLQDRNYNGLIMESRVIEGEKHSGNKPEAFNRGLRFIFQDQ